MTTAETKRPTVAAVEAVFTRLLRAMVAHPKDVLLNASARGETVFVYTVKCHGDDAGRIVGAGGERFRSLRTLMAAAGERTGCLMKLRRVDEPEQPQATRAKRRALVRNEQWPKEQVRALLEEVCALIWRHPPRIESRDMKADEAMLLIHQDARETPRVWEIKALGSVFEAVAANLGAHVTIDTKTEEKT